MKTARSVSESQLRSLALAGWREADPDRKARLALDTGEAATALARAGPGAGPVSAPDPASDPVSGPVSDPAIDPASIRAPRARAARLAEEFVAPEPAQALRPGRPARPRLVPPLQVPKRPIGSEAGRAALLHAIAHIEFNAIDLALDAVWRFDRVPPEFRIDWASVAADEARHFAMLRGLLRERGHDYGDFDAHDGLWQMALRTRDDLLARMALVPRVMEARGLDATPPIQARLAQAGDARAVAVLQVILDEEVRHVAIGNRWYGWLCAQRRLDPVATFESLARAHGAPRPPRSMNRAARLAAGFSEAELDAMGERSAPAGGRVTPPGQA